MATSLLKDFFPLEAFTLSKMKLKVILRSSIIKITRYDKEIMEKAWQIKSEIYKIINWTIGSTL